MLALVLAAAACCAPGDEVRSRVGGVEVVLDLPGYRENGQMMKTYRSRYGERALLFGGLGEGGAAVTISVIAERDDPHLASREWRRKITREDAPRPGAEHFDCGDVACRVQTKEGDIGQVSYNAFPVAGGWCFDIHVSEVFAGGNPEMLTRDAFLAVVKSFRAGYYRRGGSADYPDEVNAVVHEAARRFPADTAWVATECEAHPDDWARHFVLGMHRHKDAPTEALKAYLRAADLLAKRKDPGPKEAFARMLAEEGAGIALAATGKPKEGAARLEASVALAVAAKSPLLATLHYNLACARALVPDAPGAARALREAIALDAKFRDMAREDSDFEKVRSAKEMKEVLEGK